MTAQTTHQDTDLIDDIESFYRRYYSNEIAQLAQKYPRDQKSLRVEWMDVNQFDIQLGRDVHEQPDQMREYFEEALRQYDLPVDISLDGASVRFAGLTDPHTYEVDEIAAEHRTQLLQVTAQVQKLTQTKPRITLAAFECQRCGTLTRIPQDGGRKMQEPHECQGCERQGPFRINYNQSAFVDHQLVRVQMPPEKTKGGQGPTMDVVCERDLVGRVDGGDRVTIAGVLELQQEDERQKSTTFDPFVSAHDITIEQTDYEDIDVEHYEDEIHEIATSENPIELMAASIEPEIYGHDLIKKAVTLQLFGGTSVPQEHSGDIRGDFHVLLIGDPGCGKSTILDAVEEIAPRSVKASGKGTSASGLTAAAVQDSFGNTDWSLQAGAMVMADKGIACIDEIDKIDEETTSSLHEALENQQIPINKAGINTKLPSRTSLLAAGNPKYGRFDRYEPLGEQIDIDPPLMSRFDLIFTLTDQPDAEHDEQLARHAIEYKQNAVDARYHSGTQSESNKRPIETEVFRAYIAYAKQNVNPKITDRTKEELVQDYVSFRGVADEETPIPITPRYIGALQRLSEAAARARLSETVEEQDMELAVDLMIRSLEDVGMDPESGEFDADVIETGMSQSQRERIKSIKELIAEIEAEYNRGAPHEIVVERAEELGIEREQTQHELKNLKDKGEVYEPKSEHYRVS